MFIKPRRSLRERCVWQEYNNSWTSLRFVRDASNCVKKNTVALNNRLWGTQAVTLKGKSWSAPNRKQINQMKMKQTPRSMDTLTDGWRCPDGAPVVPPGPRAPCRPPSVMESWREERTRSLEDNEMSLPGIAAAYHHYSQGARGRSAATGAPQNSVESRHRPCSSSPRVIRKK